MKILGREAECLDISEVRPRPGYKVIVYQKGGDCRIKALPSPDYCREDCAGIHMAVEFYPAENITEKHPSATLPPFQYFNPSMFVYDVRDLEQLEAFFQESGHILGVTKIKNEDTKVYVGAEILGIKKPRCGMENFEPFLSLPNDIFYRHPFLQDALETYRGILINRSHFERNAAEMSDEEMLREASLMVESPVGMQLLLERFGQGFVIRTKEYRKGKIDRRVC
jgi:hypothetical protein